MSIEQRIDELVASGRYTLAEAIAKAIADKQASVRATESYAHGGAR